MNKKYYRCNQNIYKNAWQTFDNNWNNWTIINSHLMINKNKLIAIHLDNRVKGNGILEWTQ
ncbi:hypothetical protein [Spiroplasma endosymbiont of Dasysyrphus albostriatus]|uniref:hypothetical protein n=1 Tax=Spiroplasma endosymbiont of Dasysyrphus albostriatus TaxID=3066299 RepID=UPI0030D3825A